MKNIGKCILPILAAAFVALACSDDDDEVFYSAPSVDFSTGSGELAEVDYNVVLDSLLEGSSYVYTYTVSIAETTSTPMMCDIVVDTTLVATYNSTYGTSYEVLPSSVYELIGTIAVIPAGSTESNELYVKISTLYGLEEGTKYLLPLTLSLDDTCEGSFTVSGSEVIYLSMDINGELDYIVALDMSTYSTDMYTILYFPDDEVVTIEDNTHTFEMLVYTNSWPNSITYFGTWRGKDTNNNNENFSGCEVRTQYYGYSNIGNRQCDLTTGSSRVYYQDTGQWTRISITCDGEMTGQNTEVAYRLYMNGELIASKAPTKRYGASSSQRFQVGYTMTGMQFGYPGYSSYRVNGYIADIRMWKKCLTQEEIIENLREVEDPSSDDLYAYWRIDEGSGTVLKDSSGNGRDLSFDDDATIVWGAVLNNLPDESEIDY